MYICTLCILAFFQSHYYIDSINYNKSSKDFKYPWTQQFSSTYVCASQQVSVSNSNSGTLLGSWSSDQTGKLLSKLLAIYLVYLTAIM